MRCGVPHRECCWALRAACSSTAPWGAIPKSALHPSKDFQGPRGKGGQPLLLLHMVHPFLQLPKRKELSAVSASQSDSEGLILQN